MSVCQDPGESTEGSIVGEDPAIESTATRRLPESVDTPNVAVFAPLQPDWATVLRDLEPATTRLKEIFLR